MSAAHRFVAADLFCGGGGFSKGFGLACAKLGIKNVRLIAINHSQVAIESHKANHPWAEHHCARVDQLDPRKLVPDGRMKILIASPECTNHANARGGRPINDQSRASAFRVLEWCDKLDVANVLIENVPEFVNWGPISGSTMRPIKSKRGEIFRNWVAMLEGLNYRVAWRVLNSADYGGATTRRRLFVIARKRSGPIRWPQATHAKDGGKGGQLFGDLKPWRAAREIIDWSLQGESIFTRKRPLARTTLERIAAGLRKFCGEAAEPFLVILRRHMDGKSLDEPVPCLTASGQHIGIAVPKGFLAVLQENNVCKSIDGPLPTITAQGKKIALVEPFVLGQQTPAQPRKTDKPLPTIATAGAVSLVMPAVIVPNFGERNGQKPRTHDVDAPLPAPTSHGAGALVQPEFIVTPGGPDLVGGRSVNGPLPTVVCKDRLAVVTPEFIVGAGGPTNGGKPKSVDVPMDAVLTENQKAVVQPVIIPLNHGAKDFRSHSTDAPMPCLTSVDAWAIVEPHLVKFYRDPKSQHQSIDDPLHTVPTKDRFGLVEPTVGLDIRFRMLRPPELARAMGFENYQFTGTREEQVKQIGNAVEVNTAKALVMAILDS